MQPGKGWPKVGKTGTDLPYTPREYEAVLQPVAFPQQYLGPKAAHLPRFVNTLPHVAYVLDSESVQQP